MFKGVYKIDLLFSHSTSVIISQNSNTPITMMTMQNMMTESDFRALKAIIRTSNLRRLLGANWFNIVEGTKFDSDDASIERHTQFIAKNSISTFENVIETPIEWESETEKKPEPEAPEREALSPEVKEVWDKIVSGDIDIDVADWLK